MKTYYTFKAFHSDTIYRRLDTGVDVVEFSSYMTYDYLFETHFAAETLRQTLVKLGYNCWPIEEITKDDRGLPLIGAYTP